MDANTPSTTSSSQAKSDMRRNQFRFKSTVGQPYPDPHGNGRDSREHRRHRHHHRHHRRHDGSRNSEAFDNVSSTISAEDAFRESLFDALADDEGAAYWEGIYSQPIHQYERQWVHDEDDGLRRMNDDEYATYVRSEMWKRTREGMLEEQEKRRKKFASWRKAQEKAEQVKRDRTMFDQLMEESLSRGRERHSRKQEAEGWARAWQAYTLGWEKLNMQASNATTAQSPAEDQPAGNHRNFRNLIFWPVRSGKRQDVTPKAVEAFLRNAPLNRSTGKEDAPELRDFASLLKVERVRWHPDKIQHRYGGLDVEKHTMQTVTEIFQIIDRLWNEACERGN